MTIYYVSLAGNDSNPGTQALPWRYIQKACDTAVAGDTVHVLPGIYDQLVDNPAHHFLYIPVGNNGTASARIQFISDIPHGAKILASGTRGINATWYVGGDYIDVIGFDITGDMIGLYVTGSHGSSQLNYIHDTINSGLFIGDNAYASVDHVSQRNLVVNCGTTVGQDHGIYHAITNGRIENNIVLGGAGYGIQLWHAANAITIANNLCGDNAFGGITVGAGDAPGTVTCDNCIISNNITINSPNYGWRLNGTIGTNNIFYNNCSFGNTLGAFYTYGTPTHSGDVFSDPRLVNYQVDGSGDYHLLHTSPCVDAGIVTGAPSTDYDGVARPQLSGFDIGPYEFVLTVPLVDIAGQSVFVEAGTLSFERTVGRRSQASCTILTTTATHYQQDQQVAIYDKKNTLVFSGYITSPKEYRPGFQPTLEHDISCVDQHRIADKRVVAATYTNKTPGYIAMDIYNNILASEGVTIGLIYDGAALADLFPNTAVFPSTTLYPTESVGVIPSAIFAYCTVAQAFDELVKSASASGVPYYWMIDERKRLWFVPYTAIVNNTVIDGTQVDDGTLSGMVPNVIRANPTYRNTQYLLGGVAQTVTQNETRKGDGNTTSWPMSFDLASAPTITVNTVAKTVGIRGLDTGKDWYWQKGSPDISQDSSGTKLISTDTLAVTYIGQYPTVIIDQNNAQISYEQSLDSTTGIVEEVESDATITSVANGLATTSQLLTRYAQQGLILEFMTLNSSYGPGQLVTVNLPDYGINNEQMLIEEVTASDQTDGFNIWYDVKAIQGPYDMNWVAFFSKTLAQQTIANSINVGIGQSVVIAASGSVTFTPGVTGSATVFSCPVPSTSTFPSTSLFPC